MLARALCQLRSVRAAATMTPIVDLARFRDFAMKNYFQGTVDGTAALAAGATAFSLIPNIEIGIVTGVIGASLLHKSGDLKLDASLVDDPRPLKERMASVVGLGCLFGSMASLPVMYAYMPNVFALTTAFVTMDGLNYLGYSRLPNMETLKLTAPLIFGTGLLIGSQLAAAAACWMGGPAMIADMLNNGWVYLDIAAITLLSVGREYQIRKRFVEGNQNTYVGI